MVPSDLASDFGGDDFMQIPGHKIAELMALVAERFSWRSGTSMFWFRTSVEQNLFFYMVLKNSMGERSNNEQNLQAVC